MSYDLVIRGAKVVDGTGMPAFVADVGVESGRIAKIGRIEAGAEAVREIDARGLVLSPGFIDVHTHYDAQLDWDPMASSSCWHGVTTIIAGNCGFTLAPAKPEDVPWLAGMLSRVEGMSRAALAEGLRFSGGGFDDYWGRFDNKVGLNVGAYVGHCAVRRYVMGDAASERTATDDEIEAPLAYEAAHEAINHALGDAGKIALLVSPMLSCEDAYLLASCVNGFSGDVVLGVGPVPMHGEDKTFADGFRMHAEKAPNARGVERVLTALGGKALAYDEFAKTLRADAGIEAVVLTGNYPSDWVNDDLLAAVGEAGKRFLLLIDTLPTKLAERADVFVPGATWAEKAGTFENVDNRLQAFDRAIDPIDYCKSEAQLAMDIIAFRDGDAPQVYNPAQTRQQMAAAPGLEAFTAEVAMPEAVEAIESDMQMVEL